MEGGRERFGEGGAHTNKKSACNNDRGAEVWATKGKKNERRIQEESRMVRRKDDAVGVELFVVPTMTSENGKLFRLFISIFHSTFF